MNATLETNGTTLHWRQDGDPQGAPVLLLNSLGTDLHLWDAVIPHLSGHRVIRLDTRGHGHSDAPTGDYTLAQLVADATALIDHLALPRLSVVGVSLGGMMAQALAAQMPDRIARVVLSNTAPRLGTAQAWADRIAAVRTGGIESIADAILDRLIHNAHRIPLFAATGFDACSLVIAEAKPLGKAK
jgi:3-oxoadipate enol-lactonase